MRIARSLSLLGLTATSVIGVIGSWTTTSPDPGVLPSQRQVQVRLEQGSKVLPAPGVKAAIAGAIAAWNAALPADLKLVEAAVNAPIPAGEAVFLVRFDNDPTHFGKGGIDEIGDTRILIDRAKNNLVIAVFLVDKAGSLSVAGTTTTRDLQLVLMHELGHALGVEHDLRSGSDPTIMAPSLDDNGKLLERTHKTLAALRQLSSEDRSLLEIAMLKRKSRDMAGSYTGTLKVESVVSGTGTIALNTAMPVRAGDLVVSYDAGKVVIVYKGSRRELPAVDLLRTGVKLDFPSVADGRPLKTITISRGNTPDEILVDAEIAPSSATYQITGTLKRS